MIFEKIRSLILPFEELVKYAPQNGSILDVGCGHGILSEQTALATKSSVLGIDPSKEKIKLAKKNRRKLKNLTFKTAYLEEMNEKDKFNTIFIIDVIYLLPEDEIIKLYKKAAKLLKKNGTLIVKDVIDNNHWSLNLLKLEEFLATKVLKFTYSDFGSTSFFKRSKHHQMLKKCGFNIKSEKYIKSIVPYPHYLMEASR